MDETEFDRFADEYDRQHRANIAVSGEDPEYFAAYKIAWLARAVGACRLAADSVLDFGGGIGNSIPHFRNLMPQSRLVCADVSKRSLALAEKRCGGDFTPLLIENDRLPSPDGSFAITFSACVFHHIPGEAHRHWLSELSRVTHPGGTLCVFEHNPLNPLTRHAVNTCPFDVNAKLIRARDLARTCRAAGWSRPNIAYHVFFPRRLSLFRRGDRYLERLPLGAQYSVMATKPG